MYPYKKKNKKDYAKIYRLFEFSLSTLPEKFEKEYRFSSLRNWKIDYYFKLSRLAVEIEGGIWIQGRHNRASGFIKEMEKYNTMAKYRMYLMRFTPDQVESGEALIEIKKWFMEGCC